MRSLLGFLVLAALVVGEVSSYAFQSGRPWDGYWRCFSAPDQNPIYFTGVWEERALPGDVQTAFAKFLGDKHGYKGRVSCAASTRGASDLAKAKADSVALQQHYQKNGSKVIDTGWTHTASATATVASGVAPGTATPAPTAGQPTHWGACKIDRYPPAGAATKGYYSYISDVFPHDPKTMDLVKVFDAFVDAQYGVQRDIPNCNIRPSEAGVREMHKAWIDEANKTGKAILTGWKYPGK